MDRNIIDAIAVITAILLLIFAYFAFSYKKGKIISHRILGAFLLVNSLYIINFSLNAIGKSIGLNLQSFNGVGSSFGFLFGPLIYLYSKSLTQKDFSLKVSNSVHLSFFVFALLSILLNIEIPYEYRYGVLYLQITPYMMVSFIVILQYRKRIRDYYSSIEKLNLTWMLYVVGAFFFMWIVDLMNFLLADFNLINRMMQRYLAFLSLMINFVFAILIFYKALQYPEIFSGLPEQEKRRKYTQSRLTDNEKSQYLRKLKQYFLNKKPYLNSELTINDVAEELGISSKYLSQVINESFGKNFYDFINSYRIAEAKENLLKDSDPKKTVLEVLYDSGFNSKSAFNTAFKKHTGYTPTQFKKQTP